MATVNKNFRIKQGLVVEGTTGTINGQNILTETGSDTYILNLIGGETLVKSVSSEFNVSAGGELSIDRTTVDAYYDAAGSAATAQSNAEDYADGLAVNYDAAGSAATAQSNAEDYADGLASNYDAAGSAATAEDNANTYTDNLIGDITVDGTSGNTVTARIATAVANLVDSAPAALDTLNELAAALGDNVDGMTGIATAIGNKLPLAGGTMSGNIAMGSNKVTGLGAPSSDNDAATKKYVDDQTTTDVAEGINLYFTNQRALDATSAAYDADGTASGLVDDLKDGTTKFTAINVNDIVSQRAAQATLASVSTGSSVMSWAKSDYATAKAWVKFATGTHSQISEILLTTDSANNVSITEFAEVGTNGSLGTVTASYLTGNIAIEVNTVYANTTVTVLATLIK